MRQTLNNNSQISALLNIQHMLIHNESARREDVDALNARFSTLERNQTELRRALGLCSSSSCAYDCLISSQMLIKAIS
jgi:hypothetical protein